MRLVGISDAEWSRQERKFEEILERVWGEYLEEVSRIEIISDEARWPSLDHYSTKEDVHHADFAELTETWYSIGMEEVSSQVHDDWLGEFQVYFMERVKEYFGYDLEYPEEAPTKNLDKGKVSRRLLGRVLKRVSGGFLTVL